MVEKVGFWTEGGSRHAAGLDAAEAGELARLEERLQSASVEERAVIELELERIRRKYREERRGSEQNLYLGRASRWVNRWASPMKPSNAQRM